MATAFARTYSLKLNEIKKNWYVIDATDLVLGRLASKIAILLMGKHKPEYTPNLDAGDNVIVINAEKVHLSGNKIADKEYFWHTGYPGGIKSVTAGKVIEGKYPERVLRKAVERMLTRNPLGRKRMTNLYIYGGTEHPHTGQKPVEIDFAKENNKNKKR